MVRLLVAFLFYHSPLLATARRVGREIAEQNDTEGNLLGVVNLELGNPRG